MVGCLGGAAPAQLKKKRVGGMTIHIHLNVYSYIVPVLQIHAVVNAAYLAE